MTSKGHRQECPAHYTVRATNVEIHILYTDGALSLYLMYSGALWSGVRKPPNFKNTFKIANSLNYKLFLPILFFYSIIHIRQVNISLLAAQLKALKTVLHE